MKLSAIRRLNLVTMALLVSGLLSIFGGLAVSLVVNSLALFQISFTSGGIMALASLALSFVVDRVKCPQCGKPFNRPAYRNWFVRHFAKTQPRWTCAHCGFGE